MHIYGKAVHNFINPASVNDSLIRILDQTSSASFVIFSAASKTDFLPSSVLASI